MILVYDITNVYFYFKFSLFYLDRSSWQSSQSGLWTAKDVCDERKGKIFFFENKLILVFLSMNFCLTRSWSGLREKRPFSQWAGTPRLFVYPCPRSPSGPTFPPVNNKQKRILKKKNLFFDFLNFNLPIW
jgi:hypothetical protein